MFLCKMLILKIPFIFSLTKFERIYSEPFFAASADNICTLMSDHSGVTHYHIEKNWLKSSDLNSFKIIAILSCTNKCKWIRDKNNPSNACLCKSVKFPDLCIDLKYLKCIVGNEQLTQVYLKESFLTKEVFVLLQEYR